MKPLTDLQRETLVRQVARALAWYDLSGLNKDAYTFRAKAVIRDLEAVAVHGASAKRAAEIVLIQPDAEASEAVG